MELAVQFPARGSTQVLLCLFFLVCCDCDTSYIVSVNIQFQASIYTLSLCRGLSWRVRLAKQETLTPPGYLLSPLVCRGPWMSTVVLYCWCHSDSASGLLYFTLYVISLPFYPKFNRASSASYSNRHSEVSHQLGSNLPSSSQSNVWVHNIRIPLKTRLRATLLLPTWICSCQSIGTVNFALPLLISKVLHFF